MSPSESFNSFSLFSTLSMFKFLTQITFSRPFVYSALNKGCPDFLITSNCIHGNSWPHLSNLFEVKNFLMPSEDPPQLQNCKVIFLHGNTNAPTPLRPMEFRAIAFTTISPYIRVCVST
ncbi:uncharacterized protein YPR099C [Saccharomyces cerevisiae S288C]|uniref:Mitochondrial protein YPR099C n=2 Tax=Saccharomyces cerevisiae TaxID=4932 RepID=YP099_YEAST|nr:uncharacterized protein YPR099C [Saccharomyces cerevisiae S288C]O13548.1 RecName: Full=Mitochondrial protein YPR099C [Saccharomyces cerevisiae S288C]AAB68088.1 Ypr99cp [Saccharomyces cerevisiae]CAY87052.1 EC1118_1P2_4236p [Saccharomyces cerevisiae EC1118]AAT93297.1 YPR099C [Saccharomyces cerevisiae]KZV07611.1 hypothetical protein WN66_06651 [Saccharomyces cerevisiae]DAC85312.1 TPA: hypothetical protein YPR099C [Saccharomyces cerevisiae S288C]